MKVINIRQGHRPEFRFEWHPETKVVYVVRLALFGESAELADPIAYDVENHGAAVNATLIWSRGYKYRAEEPSLVLGGR